MKPAISCTNPGCIKFKISEGERPWILPHGEYERRCDSKVIPRFRCKECGKTFSNQTFNPTYRHHRPRLNPLVRTLLCSKMSMRRISLSFGMNRKTVKRKFLFLAEQARLSQAERLSKLSGVNFVHMDEMETFEHTKCKPLSIAIAVVPGSRLLLGLYSSEMPAKGPLAKISREKYGQRRDDRKGAFQALLSGVKGSLTEDVWFFTDKKSTYPGWIKGVYPDSKHFKAKGRRGAVVGYGEMKKTAFDPLFYVNHTAAMVRDNLARMLRRTWCTTKFRVYLQEALDLYTDFHNELMETIGKPMADREKHLNLCRLRGVLI